MASSTDRIHVTYPLHARRSRIWEAISDAGQFGFWFGAEFNGQFAVGTPLTGRIVPTRSQGPRPSSWPASVGPKAWLLSPPGVHMPDGFRAVGTFLHVDSPHHLAFT